MKFHARLERRAVAAILAYAHIARGHAFDRAVFVIKHFRAGKSGIDFDAKRFGLLTKPAAQATQADDVIAFIVEARRQE